MQELERNAVRAFVVAPLGGVAVIAVPLAIDPVGDPLGFALGPLFLAFVTAGAYVVTFVLGMPAFVICRRLGLARPATFVVGGAILGSLPVAAFALPDWASVAWWGYLSLASAGAASGVVFAAVIRRRSDKGSPPRSNQT